MEKLKQIREEKGFSQIELAEKSGVSRVTISMLETGTQKNTTANTLLRLSEALGVPIDDFFKLTVKYTKQKGANIMNNLDLVEIRNNQVVVSSRQVAEKFGKEHRHVLESIRQILGAENSAAKFFNEDYVEYRGQKFPIYLMNRDGFTLLTMSFNGKAALQWKMKYIAAFNEMEARLKSNAMVLPDFTNPAEAARAWAEQFEKCNKAEQQLKAAEPKVIFADAVSASDTTILIGDID